MTDAVIRTLSGHTDTVMACAVSPDNRLIASASADKTARIWSAESGTTVATLVGHDGTVTDCAFSPDGKFVVTAGDDRTLRIWDASSWTERATLRGHTNAVMACAVGPDASFIVSAGLDGALGVWDVATGKERTILRGHQDHVFDCAISPDGRLVASASPDATVGLWDPATGTKQTSLKGSLGVEKFYGCAFSHDGSLVVGTSDTEVYVWEVASGKRKFKMSSNGVFFHCAFSADDKLLVTAGALYNTLAVWDLSAGSRTSRLLGGGSDVKDCCFSSDGRFIVSADGDLQTLRIWDVQRALQLGRGACFIATAAYGSADHAEVARLREFRDTVLRRTRAGRAAITIYECVAPPLAGVVARSSTCRSVVRLLIRSIGRFRREM